MNKEYFLGIDGGSTKSKLILLDLKGKKVTRPLGALLRSNKCFEAKGKCLGHRSISEENFIQDVSNIINKIKHKKILFGCFSLADVDIKKDKRKVVKWINKVKSVNFPFIVVSDIECVLLSVYLESGVAVIAGTGSNYYAKNGDLVAKAGGLGYILADEGSGFSIGQKVLRAALKSYDGRGKKTILENLVLKKAGIKNMRKIITSVYTNTFKLDVGEFAPLTELALKKKDKVAKKILLSAVDEIESGIITVIKKVKLRGDFKICFVGGVFKNKFLLTEVERRIKKRFKKAEIIIVKNPAIGAAKLAIKEFERLNK